MFLLHGDAKYLDVLERVIYNGFLSGVSLTGDRFFYPNPLESDGKGKFNQGSCERAPWFGCSCCPVNDVRFIPEIASFIYATRGSDLFVNLFIGGSAKLELAGTAVEVSQETRYPWDGKVSLSLKPAKAKKFTLNLRIPGWARNQPLPSDLYRYDDGLKPHVKLGSEREAPGAEAGERLRANHAHLEGRRHRHTRNGNARAPVVAHPEVKADRDCFALERGPLVYCAEGADNGGKVLDKVLAGKLYFETQQRATLLGGIITVKMTPDGGSNALTCIPYYAWCHRGPNEMRVWFPTKPQ